MRMRWFSGASVGFLSRVLVAAIVSGQELTSDRIANWAAPSTWSPSRSAGVHTLSDATKPLPFIGLPPCRILDTRGNGAPLQGGIFTGGSDVRSYTIPPICGVATNAAAVSLNFTVTGPGQTTAGFLLAWPTGGAVPPVSILNWDHVPAQVANAAVVPTNGSGSITVNVSAPTHVIMDINGYYSSFPASPNSFLIYTSASYAVQGQTTNTSSSSYGVLGFTSSVATDSAGVEGQDGSGNPSFSAAPLAAGVRGDSATRIGVLGRSRNVAVIGALYNGAGTDIGEGYLGTSFGTAADMTSGAWAVFASGALGATGAKHFVEPHPEDPNKVILYSSIEGRTVDTYFRGTARFINREAIIEVPEDFRIVTDEEGLTVQVTPIGGFASAYVESRDLNRIVVRASRDIEFDYLVQGVRRAFKDFQPVQIRHEFMPRSPEDRMPAYLTEEAKRRLIANGTYNADGTVNMETAQRAGWTKIWADREAETEAAVAREAQRRAILLK